MTSTTLLKSPKKPRSRDASPVRPTSWEGMKALVVRATELEEQLTIKCNNVDPFESMQALMERFQEEGRVFSCQNCRDWFDARDDKLDNCPTCNIELCDDCLKLHAELCKIKDL